MQTKVLAVDLRNHGQSPWISHETMSLSSMAVDVANFVQKTVDPKEHVALVGHSLGGKVAMTLALNPSIRPSNLSHLIVVDMAPKSGQMSSLFLKYLEKMKEIDQKHVRDMSEADRMLAEVEQEKMIRQFILTNLIPKQELHPSALRKDHRDDHLYFRVNLEAIEEALDSFGDFHPPPQPEHAVDLPTLFLYGKRADYVKPEDEPLIKKYFSNAKLEGLDAGHWVHFERPKEFMESLQRFVSQNP